MADINRTLKKDMDLIPRLAPYTTPQNIPLSFSLGDEKISGIPSGFNPIVKRRLLDCNMLQIVVEGEREGLVVRAEYIEYRDFPVTEWVFYIENRGGKNTPVISGFGFAAAVPGRSPVLIHGNGDTCREDGYEFFTDTIDMNITLSPEGGTSCFGAFPYMRLLLEDCGINLAVGWPAQWRAAFSPCADGVNLEIGQKRLYTFLKPGEIIRTPRVNMMGFTGDESRGRNLWRRWYIAHILPRENGSAIPPKLCLHTFEVEGKPEFTGITEQNQINGIKSYISRGLKPDIWWIDAGWYPCDFDWPRTGTWIPNPDRLPNGLGPVGRACDENGIQLLLWFEPERVRKGTQLYTQHPEWLLKSHDENGTEDDNSLLNLGNSSCCDWLIGYISALIEESRVRVYRQDFNFSPMKYWVENETGDREGILENLHVQGYLRYWDELILRHPGLWIDSCASGGRRNDLETMRRAVPLHYTDVGYGNHPIKQKQHREMFEWIPYFRAHTMSWDNDEGTYVNGGKPVDEFAYHCALAPALTSMVENDDSEELFKLARGYDPVWRKAAEIMLSGDYYPLTECRKNPEDYYAMQFDDPTRGIGFIQIVANTRVKKDSFTVYPFADGQARYLFENPLTGEKRDFSGAEIKKGFTLFLPKRSGAIWFYKIYT